MYKNLQNFLSILVPFTLSFLTHKTMRKKKATVTETERWGNDTAVNIVHETNLESKGKREMSIK